MIRLTLSRKVFGFFFVLTAMSFIVAAMVYFSLEKLEGASQRINRVNDFRFLVADLEDSHHVPRNLGEWLAIGADDLALEEKIDRAQGLAREISRENAEIDPALAQRLSTLEASLGYYRNAVRELRARSRADDEFSSAMPAESKRIYDQIANEPPHRQSDLRELFSRLLILRGYTYRNRELSRIPEMKELAERIARIAENQKLTRYVNEYISNAETNYLNFLGMRDRDDFLDKTSARLFEVTAATVATLTEGLIRIRQDLIWKIYALVAVSVVLTFLLWRLANRYFKRFLSHQEDAMRAIQAGDYDYPSGRTSNDELGDLGMFLKAVAIDLKESKAHISNLLASTAEAIYGLDLDGSCTFANAACARMLGFASARELLGLHMHSLMHHTDADGSPIADRECAACRAYRQGIQVHAEEAWFWRRDGTGFPVEFWSSPIQREGRTVGAVVTFFDISRRKQAEKALHESQALLQSFMDYSPAVIFFKDSDGRYRLVNRRFQELFNPSNEDLSGKTDYDLFPRELADAFAANDREVLQVGVPRAFEERALQADGEHQYMSIKFPLLDREGASRGVCGIATDVTERLRTEEALRQSHKMEAIGQLTGGIAHDFNNLLGIIIGNLELIGDELESDGLLRRRVDGALRAGLRGADLTQRLLAFSRRSVTEASPVDVNRAIKSMSDMLQRVLTAAVEVETKLADALWLTEINPDELENALVNLAINARDAMAGEGVLTLETANLILDGASGSNHKGVAPGEYVTITVSDTGVGIDPDQREHIFEPFFTTKPPGKGTGLGLSMVYGFVKRARGDVLVESEPGRGTLVRLYLPRSAAAATKPDDTAESLAEAPGGSETILVVDDEEDLAMLAKTGLSRLGYRVLTAGDAQQAMEILAAHPTVELLFTDLVMPGKMDGLSLAETATRKFPGLKVLLASGYSQRADNSAFVRYRQNLVPKPYRIAELAARIRNALDKEAGV